MKSAKSRPELFWVFLTLLVSGYGLFIWVSGRAQPTVGSGSEFQLTAEQGEAAGGPAATIVIHLAGAVKRPGVYRLPENARLIEGLNAAGGALPSADLDGLNLAQAIKDGQKIVVPVKQPLLYNQSGESAPGQPAGQMESSRIVLNSASLEQLQTLPGIGPKLAQNIWQYRETHGPFTNWEDLRNVQGIGAKRLAKIKEAAVL